MIMVKVECPRPYAPIHRMQFIANDDQSQGSDRGRIRKAEKDAQPAAHEGGVESSRAYQKRQASDSWTLVVIKVWNLNDLAHVRSFKFQTLITTVVHQRPSRGVEYTEW